MFVGERLQIKILSRSSWVTTKNAINKDIRHMNTKTRPYAHKDLKDTNITIRSMNIEHMNVNPNPNGHQTSRQR